MNFCPNLMLQLVALLALMKKCSWNAMAFQALPLVAQKAATIVRPFSVSTKVYRTASKWDDIVDEDDEEDLVPGPPDMKYVPRNVMRQHQHFGAIRDAGGPEMTYDVYVPEPDSDGVFWFVGKLARISDIPVEQAVARQWPLIVQHAANLRPIELYPSRAQLEVWIAPGDSELEVAYNRPTIVFQKMCSDVDGAKGVKSNLIGFQGEVYEQGQGGAMGFRTWRTRDGKAAKPELQTPEAPEINANDGQEFSDEKFAAPTAEDLEKLQNALKDKNMDISQLYEEQQKQDGNSSQ